ncbi:MAG TPA: hypothetical protein VGP71_06155 [Burkholderiales bacterium]|jgi:hypothetical protein|nr:hypothetical protein [Burkholderiales bacterium]
MVSRRTLSLCLSGAVLLISACAVAYAQKNAGGAKDAGVQTITVTGQGDPVDKSYRRMVLGMDLFERNRGLAPDAPLRFKLLPRRKDTDMSSIRVEIVGETVEIPVKVASDNTFTLERIQKALDEDASVRPNRKAQTMTWRTEIRTPGLPPNTRRLGDLRLECAVGMEADLVSNRRSALQRIADLFGATRNYCSRLKPRYFFFAERPLFSVTLSSGARRETLSADMLYASALDRPMSKEDFAFCDCEVLLDRAYFLPLGDRSWPDDTRVEFEYMDDERVAAKTLPTGNVKALSAQSSIAVGKSTKADVIAALGKSMVVPFDNGFEVWAYRFKDPSEETPQKSPSKDPPKPPPRETELVVLFAPSGIATKTRMGLAAPVDGN